MLHTLYTHISLRCSLAAPNWQELRDCRKDRETSGLAVELPDEANLMHWRGTLNGPVGTPYEGGVFSIDIRLPPDYPFVPPKVCVRTSTVALSALLTSAPSLHQMKYETKIWHPNISSETGAICLDILKNEWSPALTVRTGGICCPPSTPRNHPIMCRFVVAALISLQALMSAPEPGAAASTASWAVTPFLSGRAQASCGVGR